MENSREEILSELSKMRTDLNKISYLEKTLRLNYSFEVKRFILAELVKLYEERLMFDKAAVAMSNRAGIDITFREKIESYLKAGELYARAGKIEDSEAMFTRAVRDASIEQKAKILLARKNIYITSAKNLERVGKRASALKFYEKLIKMKLNDLEKQEIKQKLLDMYKRLGKFKEAELLAGV